MARSAVQKYDPMRTFESLAINLASPDKFYGILPMFKKFDDHIQLREFILYHKGDFSSVIDKICHTAKVEVHGFDSSSWLYSVRTISKNEADVIEGLLAFIPGKYPNMFRAVTVSKSIFWANVVRKLVKRSYPEAMRVFFKQNEIHEALKILENNIGENGRVNILDGTLKAKRNAGQNLGRTQFNTDRVWRDQPVDEMFEDALEKNQWFTSLTFAIEKKNEKRQTYPTVATGKIGKFGEVSSDAYFSEIEEYIISVLEGFASDRLALYQKRGIRERNFQSSPPLEIQYDIDVFDDIEEIRRFGKTMVNYPDSSIAVFHGNPYYHANIADFADGSSFDVWILSPNRVLIAPQARSTPQSLERITAYIFYEFREGTVSEYVE